MTFTSMTCFAAMKKEEGLHSQTMEMLAAVFPTAGLSTSYKWMKQGDWVAQWAKAQAMYSLCHGFENSP